MPATTRSVAIEGGRRHQPSRLGEQLHRWIEYPALGTPFGDRLWDRPRADPIGWTPAVELIENEREFLFTVELPGARKEDVNVSVDDGTLSIRGEKRFESERERGRVRVWERAYGSFERSFVLPPHVDESAILARFERGVLEVHVPKAEAATGLRIDIR
jgi:HSP20 family protein